MLIEFRVANFRSFHEEQTLSLVASKDKALPGNLITGDLIPGGKLNLLKSAALYGANASGKSNLIKALMAFQAFITRSATRMNLDDRIPGIVPFKLSTDSREKPSTFEAAFIVGDTRYRYGFSATSERVHAEWLDAHPPPPSRKQTWFEREYDPETDQTKWTFRGPLAKEKKILVEMTRDNGLVLSRGAELNIESLKGVYRLFSQRLYIADLSDHPVLLIQETANHVRNDTTFEKRVVKMLQHADLGIDGVTVVEDEYWNDADDLARKIAETFVNENPVEMTRWAVRTAHRLVDSEEHQVFDLGREESNGTRRFFGVIGLVLTALDKGMVLVFDELDSSMHPLLTRKVIELFQSPDANTKGAQLIFATHDSTQMDSELFRRDQIYIVEKKNSGASELFSLYDFDTEDRPRKAEAFRKNYLAGRYGGVPTFGPSFEDLEV